MVKPQLSSAKGDGYDRVESKPRARETSGLAVKHVPRETLSFIYFHVEHYSLIYTAYQSDER